MLPDDGPEEFEWDDEKAVANLAKHGIAFETAAEVFSDPDRLDIDDDRFDYGEERRNAVGAVEDVVLTVSYTTREGVCRIISARRASRKEREAYGNRSI
ncbi:MAG: BrnT family toxin [Parvibaculum sp.]|nr:BrnT family toxin [Parvibaculum sp.]